MPKLVSCTEALEHIGNWSTVKVVACLQKNGVEEACWKAVEKRQIDGDQLLHLTEGKLALWKSDLTRPMIWNLWTFVEELKKCPENYVEDEQVQQQQQQQQQVESELLSKNQQLDVDTLSDSDAWDTDFEDNVDDVVEESNNTKIEMRSITKLTNPDFRNSLRMFQENDRLQMEAEARGSSYSINKINEKNNDVPITESTYANCDVVSLTSSEPSESTYANVGFAEDAPLPADNFPQKNTSKLHSTHNSNNNINNNNELQKSLAEKLKEQLMLMGTPTVTKPVIAPKPESLLKKTREDIMVRRSEPRTSFLHKAVKARVVNGTNNIHKKMNVPPPAEPTEKHNHTHNSTEETIKNLPKPPVMIRGFDLVANLPTRPAEESEDDEEESYEAFDEQIVEQHQRNSMIRTDSGQSLSSARQNSVESVYHPPSSISHDEEEVYEIYESITESPEENGHSYTNESNSKNLTNPPPLPAKPPPNITQLNHSNKSDTQSERSLEKKSATLPHSGSNTSLTNAARPLPPPPDRQSYYERPWFHNLTREEANHLIEEQCTYGNSSDGYFLMRPSTTNPNNPLTLVLWCKDRVYNVPVRRRPDNRYALGSSKPEEQSFASIDEIIPFYKKEKLVLYTGGVQTGSTRLTDTPPK